MFPQMKSLEIFKKLEITHTRKRHIIQVLHILPRKLDQITLVRAWGRTYGLPILVTNCSNNYGLHQFPEKLIPLTIINALKGMQSQFMALENRYVIAFC